MPQDKELPDGDTTDSTYSFTSCRIPCAGEDPSLCKVGVVDVATAKNQWMNVPGTRYNTTFRMEWAGNGNE